MIFNLYKKRGETPLECLERFKKANPDLANSKPFDKTQGKMTYLGRLDPLAEGVLLLASGEDTSQKRREEFFGLDKEYEFQILFGFRTDTYDVMGKIVKVDEVKNLNDMDLIKIAKIYEGEREQKYPKYSSKRIASPDVVPDNKKINIYKLQFHKLENLSSKELFGRILSDISKVNGDFRQMEILEDWKKDLLDHASKYNDGHCIARFSAHVSSGTYIRSLVNDIGNTLGFGATTLSIKRTRVGDFKIEESLRSF